MTQSSLEMHIPSRSRGSDQRAVVALMVFSLPVTTTYLVLTALLYTPLYLVLYVHMETIVFLAVLLPFHNANWRGERRQRGLGSAGGRWCGGDCVVVVCVVLGWQARAASQHTHQNMALTPSHINLPFFS